MRAGKRWMFDDEKREVLSLPPRTPVVITRVQERFLGFARNDDGVERKLTIDVTGDLNTTYDRRIPPSLQRSRPLKKGRAKGAG